MPNNIKQWSDEGFLSVTLFLKHAFDSYVHFVLKYGYRNIKVPLQWGLGTESLLIPMEINGPGTGGGSAVWAHRKENTTNQKYLRKNVLKMNNQVSGIS